jgi:hypothetical protein
MLRKLRGYGSIKKSDFERQRDEILSELKYDTPAYDVDTNTTTITKDGKLVLKYKLQGYGYPYMPVTITDAEGITIDLYDFESLLFYIEHIFGHGYPLYIEDLDGKIPRLMNIFRQCEKSGLDIAIVNMSKRPQALNRMIEFKIYYAGTNSTTFLFASNGNITSDIVDGKVVIFTDETLDQNINGMKSEQQQYNDSLWQARTMSTRSIGDETSVIRERATELLRTLDLDEHRSVQKTPVPPNFKLLPDETFQQIKSLLQSIQDSPAARQGIPRQDVQAALASVNRQRQ